MIEIDQDLVIESLLKTRDDLVFVLLFRETVEDVYRDYEVAKSAARCFSIAASKGDKVVLVLKELT